MVHPSAKKLIADIARLGTLLGFQSSTEEKIYPDSSFKIDAFWKYIMPEGSPFSEFNVAAFEVQYSKSGSYVVSNLFKAE